MKIVDQFPFDFYGSTFELFPTDKRSLILPVRPLCGAMGLDSKSQLMHIENDATMSDGLSMAVALGLRSDGSSQEREVACLSLRLLPYWHGTRTKGLEDCMSALEEQTSFPTAGQTVSGCSRGLRRSPEAE